MDITKLQNDLNTKGYTQFNLRDVNEDLYNMLLPFKCNETHNFKNEMNGLRLDGQLKSNPNEKRHIHQTYNTYTDALTARNNIIPILNSENLFQIWYFKELINFDFKTLNTKYNQIISNIYKVVRDIFGIDTNRPLKTIVNEMTYYDTGCFITDHKDGMNEDRVCSILIYLNETYDETDGGILILDGKEKVIPTFGNVAVISLSKYDVSHRVTPVVKGIGRYAVCTFVSYSED